MRTLFPCVVIAAAFLAGCSTAGDLKATKPAFIVDSKNDSRTTAGCIAEKLAAKYHRLGNTVITRLMSNGHVVQYDGVSPFGTSTGMLIEVTDMPGNASKVTGYFVWDIREYARADAEDAARTCAK